MDTYNVDRDQAKKLFISLQYGGKFENWAKEHATNVMKPSKFIIKFASELDTIAEIISQKNPKLAKVIKDKMDVNHKHNFKGALLSMFCQEYERLILEIVFNYLVKNYDIKGNNCVLRFDGIMIV
jgi:hypothetical protein